VPDRGIVTTPYSLISGVGITTSTRMKAGLRVGFFVLTPKKKGPNTMPIILAMNYTKKLGLPNFSSHSCSVSLTMEIPDVSVAAQESTRLYSLLQTAVDNEIQQVGFMPDATSYGMNNGHQPASNGQQGNGHQRPEHTQNRYGDTWNCTEGQKGFLQRIIHDNQLNPDDVERMSFDLFGVGRMACNKMQMSQLIDDLLEKTGTKTEGRRRWSRQPARS
jgi:hypothetical protein